MSPALRGGVLAKSPLGLTAVVGEDLLDASRKHGVHQGREASCAVAGMTRHCHGKSEAAGMVLEMGDLHRSAENPEEVDPKIQTGLIL